MLATKQTSSIRDALEAIDGAEIVKGSAGTNTASSTDFADATTGAFIGALEGDYLWISGVATPILITTVTDDNNLVLATPINAAHTADAKWKVKRGGIGWENVIDGGLVQHNNGSGAWIIIYETQTFGI